MDEDLIPDAEEDPGHNWDPATQVLDDLSYGESYYSDWLDLIDEEVSFVLDQEQHEVDLGHSHNPEELQAKDVTLLSTCRRKWSEISASPINIACWGQDQLADPLSAERTKWALEREVYSPRKMFRRKRNRAIMGAVVGRVWYMHAEWDADLHQIMYGTLAPGDVIKAPGNPDIHDPACPWVLIKKRVTVAAAKRLARAMGQMSEEDIELITADSEGEGLESQRNSGAESGLTRLDRSNPEGQPATGVQGTLMIVIGMYREDPEQEVLEAHLDAPLPLDPEDRFMRCWECGHETKDHPPDAETGELPATGGPCPQCMATAVAETGSLPESDADMPMLERVDDMEQIERFPAHPNGRWIIVTKEKRLVMYNDDWPYVKPDGTTLRSYPLAEYKIYDDPRYEIPHSDVSWQWNQQALATYMLQWAVDQMRTSGRIILMPRNAMVDSRGRAFNPTNRLDQIAYMKDPMLAKAVQEFQPRGLAQGWTELYSQVQNSFRSNLGTGEIGLGPNQSKDIPVGTVTAMVESGDVPVNHSITLVKEEDALFLGVIADMLQCCWTQADWVRYLGQDGAMAYEYFSGADLTGVDVEIMGDTAFDQQKSAELQKYQVFFNMTPPQQRMVAKKLNLNPSEVYQYQQDQFAFMQSMAPVKGPNGKAPAQGAGAGNWQSEMTPEAVAGLGGM